MTTEQCVWLSLTALTLLQATSVHSLDSSLWHESGFRDLNLGFLYKFTDHQVIGYFRVGKAHTLLFFFAMNIFKWSLALAPYGMGTF